MDDPMMNLVEYCGIQACPKCNSDLYGDIETCYICGFNLKKTHGGPNRGQGRKPKPSEQKFRHRLITLPPTLDNRLIEWSIKTGQEISPKLAQLIDNFLTSEGA